MGLRRFKRQIAWERMKTMQITNMNRKAVTVADGKIVRGDSPFSRLWRDFMDPKSDAYKAWHKRSLQLEAERVMKMRREGKA